MFTGMNYVNGGWLPFRPDFKSVDPATEKEIGLFPQSNHREINEAIDAAKKAQKSWRALSRINRGEYFDKLCQIIKRETNNLVDAITLETGKNENESLAEVNESLHMAQYTFGMARISTGTILPSEIAEKDCYMYRKPKGVVAVISPWNFPLAIGAFWCAAPALLEGNTVIWKPSEDTPMVAQLAAKMYEEAGFPPGVFNLLHGNGNVGEMLVFDERINHICFTGSATVGQKIRFACANSMNKTCSLEMGSKSAVIVCADADMRLAVDACVTSAYKLSGQRCVSAGRILVERPVFDNFCAWFVADSEKVEIGPLINSKQKSRVQMYNDLARVDLETKVLLNRHFLSNGYYVGPFVYTTKWRVPEKRAFLREEVFGPHVAIIPFDDLDEAVEIYNDTDYGLSCAVCTKDYCKMRKVREECDFGLGYVNLPCIGAESGAPFGGVKKSGYGGSSAAGTFDSVVHKVTWTVNHSNEIKMAQGLKT